MNIFNHLQSANPFFMMIEGAIYGIETYKATLETIELVPLGVMVDLMSDYEKFFVTSGDYYVRYSPVLFGFDSSSKERYPVSEEGFVKIGKSMQGNDLFLKDGKMFIRQECSEIIDPFGYNIAYMTNLGLQMTIQGTTYLIGALEQAAGFLRNLQ